MHRRLRSGMTLIELLVVIAIIAVLAGLLLPAILQARGAGRKAQCQTNLKQLAQAVQSFHHRMDRLPVYWGAMNGGVGERFGGWLMHLLPDLDQQVAYDNLPIFGSLTTVTGTTYFRRYEYRDANPVEWIPGTPASPDYKPAQIGTGTAFDTSGNPITYPMVIPQVGTAPTPPRKKQIVVSSTLVPRVITSATWGMPHPEYDIETAKLSLPFLADADDGSPLRSPASTGGAANRFDNSPLTNYQINAHVLTKFGPRWIVQASGSAVSGTSSNSNKEYGGYFPPPPRLHYTGSVTGTWGHTVSGSIGPVGRTFGHVTDGLSHTLLFGEGMRQCDAKTSLRFAFLPSGPSGTNSTWFNEHAFGILPSLRQATVTSGSVTLLDSRVANLDTFGTTFMFQTRPLESECNASRLQAVHGEYLMTALCDGSVRAISSLVSRREPVGAAASGRDRFIAAGQLGDHQARGGTYERWDGIWDMLMVPNDPPSVVTSNGTKASVLGNTGEVGRERGEDDPPL